MKEFDVIIIGGGMVGAALALSISTEAPGPGLRIAVVDRQPLAGTERSSAAPYEARVSALSEASIEWLKKLGAWPLIEESQRACAYQHMQVWDGEGTGEISFDAKGTGYPALGYIVENEVIRNALLQRLADTQVQLFPGQEKLGFQLDTGSKIVILDNGQKLNTPLLVAADGAESRLRQAAAIPLSREDYLHHAIVATVVTEKPHGHSARQVFLDTGPLAFLPLPDQAGKHYCSIVWSLIPDQAEQIMALPGEAFCQALTQAFEPRLGQVLSTSTRQCFRLQQRHAHQYHREGVVLVGDAAHTIHPLAGQGVNLGFQDAVVLAEEVLRAHERGDNIAAIHVLNRYQRRRKGANLAMILAMKGLQNLFAQDQLPVRWLRNTGLKLTNQLPFVKQLLARQAMGLND